jgi:hypothetical protein
MRVHRGALVGANQPRLDEVAGSIASRSHPMMELQSIDAPVGASEGASHGTSSHRSRGKESQVCIRAASGEILEKRRWPTSALQRYLKARRTAG